MAPQISQAADKHIAVISVRHFQLLTLLLAFTVLKFNPLARIEIGILLASKDGQGQSRVNFLSPTFCDPASYGLAAFCNHAWTELARHAI
jgi:hypothetical protein